MSDNVLIADTGRGVGSGSARRLRAEEKIPAIVYGLGMDPISVAVERRDLRKALSGPSGVNTILQLTVGGEVYPAIVKDMQRHPVRKTVQHVDFIQIDMSAEIVVTVPIHLEGDAETVYQEGGLVEQARNELEISTTPGNIPNEIVVDISAMDMDTTITVADLDLPAGVVANEDPERTIVTATYMATPVLDEEDEAAEEAEGEEAAAGEAGAGGEAAEGGDDAGEGGDE